MKNNERKALLQRLKEDFQPDTVLCLGLIPHLLVVSRIPLDEIVDLFNYLSKKYIIVEWIKTSDPKFLQLLFNRENIYSKLTQENFEECFSKIFKEIDKVQITEDRTIYILEKITNE